jgi:hypothetical protein
MIDLLAKALLASRAQNIGVTTVTTVESHSIRPWKQLVVGIRPAADLGRTNVSKNWYAVLVLAIY